jgi:L-fucose isomerase-like protein
MSPTFGFITVCPATLVEEPALETITGDYTRALAALGGERWAADSLPEKTDQLLLLVATGGTERIILELWAERTRTAPDQPLFLVAHPGNNSLPAALEVLARLQQDGAHGRIFYLHGPEDDKGLGQITAALHDNAIKRELQQARIGLVGKPSDWLIASSPDPATVTAAWGPTVVPIDLDTIVSIYETITDADVAPQTESLVAGATEVLEPSTADVIEVARLYLALRRVITDHELDALTVRCFDFVQNQRTTGCFALAQLTDEGVIAGCEGDLVSAIGLLWAKKLLDTTPWMANPAQLDPAGNRLTLAHCTVPRSLVESYRLRTHFESGLGVGIQGAMPAGPVTLFRIGGRDMDSVWIAEGDILRSGNAENLCRTQVDIQLTAGGHVQDLLNAPLGNHLVLVFGHHFDRLRGWWQAMSVGRSTRM